MRETPDGALSVSSVLSRGLEEMSPWFRERRGKRAIGHHRTRLENQGRAHWEERE